MASRKPMRRVLLMITCLLLVAASIANATPLTITETTDFSNTAPGSTIGALDVGVNSFSGHLAAAEDDYADYFVLTLPASTALVGWELSISDIQPFSATNGSVSVFGIPGTGTFLLQAVSGGFTLGATNFTGGGAGSGPAALASPTSLTATFLYDPTISPPLPLPPGWYATGGGYDYQFTYTVASTATAVPEPATLSLLGIGVTTLMTMRFKRRQRG